MKFWELEIGKIYKDIVLGTRKKYSLDSNRTLWVNEDEKWQKSVLGYNTLNTLQFEEFEEIKWSEVEIGTKVQVSDDKEDWLNRYFVSYKEGSIFPFEATSCRKDSFAGVDWEWYSDVYKYCRLYEEK